MLDRLEFLLGEAFVALRRNGLMTFAAISTAAVALFLLGGLGYVYVRINQYTSELTGKFDMNVNMKVDLPRQKAIEVGNKIAAMPGVKSVTLIPKEDAWQKQQQDVKVSGEGLENPLPDAFKVMLTDLKQADALADRIQQMPEVYPAPDGVIYEKDVQQNMGHILSIVQWTGGVLGFLLFMTSGILIYNAIRLTVIARRREIRIMQLVGASYFTVRTPFVIEGMIQGAIGGFIATFLLWSAQLWFVQNVNAVTSTTNIAPFPFWGMLGLLMALGAAYGLFCSSAAVREPLRQGAGFQR
jgi:cell division transport system permease protein